MSKSTSSEMTALYADLNAFQRDILWTLAREGNSKGVTLLGVLERYYGEDLNHSRLYQSIDTLVDRGLVEKGQRDRRTNDYSLSGYARDLLTQRQEWQSEGVGADE